MTALKQPHFSFYTFPLAIPNGFENERSYETYIYYIHFWRVSHFQLCEPLSAIRDDHPTPQKYSFYDFRKV